jgi:heptosyltransferase-2
MIFFMLVIKFSEVLVDKFKAGNYTFNYLPVKTGLKVNVLQYFCASVQRFLIIQTAFLGDVVLATALIEKLSAHYPDAAIDFALRKGNENLLANNPKIRTIYIWDKKRHKLKNLWHLARSVRKVGYDAVINAHRGATTGFITLLSGARERRGFAPNPLSWCYTHKYDHRFSKPGDGSFIHETARNQALIASLTDASPARPRLYPAAADFDRVSEYTQAPYICIAPSSVWATKRFPSERWAELIRRLPANYRIFLLGGPEDKAAAEDLITLSGHPALVNLSGALTIMQSAALMSGAAMNYTNDSGPMHFASAMNAPVTAVYCSTHPCFGFGPLSDKRRVVQVEDLYCKPCGLHGYPACPQGHFRCAGEININDLLWWITPQT